MYSGLANKKTVFVGVLDTENLGVNRVSIVTPPAIPLQYILSRSHRLNHPVYSCSLHCDK